MKSKQTLILLILACLLSLLPAAAGAAPLLHEGGEAHIAGQLLVADGLEGRLNLLDLDSGEVITTYDVAAPARVYASPSGRYGFAVQTEANLVNVVDSGISRVLMRTISIPK
ncbi:MAG: hypothetical protein HC875_10335 [Anaerolineales bacterium]|nr:hypothetical protein [Anaerolineales bacterium]